MIISASNRKNIWFKIENAEEKIYSLLICWLPSIYLNDKIKLTRKNKTVVAAKDNKAYQRYTKLVIMAFSCCMNGLWDVKTHSGPAV